MEKKTTARYVFIVANFISKQVIYCKKSDRLELMLNEFQMYKIGYPLKKYILDLYNGNIEAKL